jgi:integrase
MASKTLAANDLAIKAAKPKEGKATEYKIDGIDRLTLRVEASGSASFWLRYSVAGKDKRIRIGKRSVNSWADVKAKAASINATIEAGGDPHEIAVAASGETTVGQLWDAWKDAHKPPRRSEKTIAYYEQALKTYVWPSIGKDELAGKVTAVRVASLVRKVTEKSQARGHAVRSALSTIYSFGYPDLVSHNPVQGVKGPGKKGDREARDRVPTADEIGRIWNALEDGEGLERRTVLAMKLLLLTGQRNSMVAETRVDELATLTTANPVWRIGKERMKKSREQHVPLSPLAAQIFKDALAIKRSDDLVFDYDKDTIGHAMRKTCKDLKIKNLHVHDFRRALNTWCGEHGVSYDVRKRIMAHDLPDVNSRTYNFALMQGPMREALSRWSDYVVACAKSVKDKDASKVRVLRA